ncbi:hypothetical protein [Streptomyces sp. B21-083]|uniref:hypothetical protein n=1 Tax=Streptomyces sp. B21-083 TaxID=3039410 RepID=UPI002FF391D7
MINVEVLPAVGNYNRLIDLYVKVSQPQDVTIHNGRIVDQIVELRQADFPVIS